MSVLTFVTFLVLTMFAATAVNSFIVLLNSVANSTEKSKSISAFSGVSFSLTSGVSLVSVLVLSETFDVSTEVFYSSLFASPSASEINFK